MKNKELKKSNFLKYLELINEELKNIIHVYEKTFKFEGESSDTNYEIAMRKIDELKDKKNLSLLLPEWEDLRRYFHNHKSKIKNEVVYLTDKVGLGFKVLGNQALRVNVAPYSEVYVIFQHKKSLKSNPLYSVTKKIKKLKNKKK
jgi:hypothetical protein